MLLEGKQFGRYRILQCIGQGGMGEVYLAKDIQVQRQVAAKFIRLETAQAEQKTVDSSLRLFWREATALAGLDHPNILPLYDHGEIVLDGRALAYLIIPYRPEGSLATWLHQRIALPHERGLTVKLVMHIIYQASLALQYAHNHQIMHLDVKPANFLMRSRTPDDDYPDLLLSDFGIARLVNTTSTISQGMRGTPTYMAPEQWANQPVFASDQYALAVMAYELLAGRPPFQGNPLNIMYAHINEQPPLARRFNPSLPPEVDEVLQRALEKNPALRFPSIQAFAQALQMAMQSAEEATVPSSKALWDDDDTLKRVPAPLAPTLPALAHRGEVNPAVTRTMQEQIATQPASATPSSAFLAQKPRHPRRLSRFLLVLLCLVLIGSATAGIYHIAAGRWPGQSDVIPGTTWHLYSVGPLNAGLSSVVWSGTQYVAVGQFGEIITSPDGVNWTERTSGTNIDLRSIAWSGSEYVVTGNYGLVLVSHDGDTWSELQQIGASDDSASAVFVTWTGNRFIAVGDHGAVFSSPDASVGSWVSSPVSATTQLWGVASSGRTMVVVGDNGMLYASSDGNSSTWFPYNTGTGQLISSVIWADNQFLAVGFDGRIYTALDASSPDALSWTPYNTGLPKRFFRVIWSGTQYVLVGEDGTILTSPDGTLNTWKAQHAPTSLALYSIASSGTQLVVVGDQNTVAVSP